MNESISIVISIVAIILSIIVPFVIYELNSRTKLDIDLVCVEGPEEGKISFQIHLINKCMKQIQITGLFIENEKNNYVVVEQKLPFYINPSERKELVVVDGGKIFFDNNFVVETGDKKRFKKKVIRKNFSSKKYHY